MLWIYDNMMKPDICRKCNVILTGDNQFPSVRCHGERICKKCYSKRQHRYIPTKEQRSQWDKAAYKRLKALVLNTYGGKCECCGETEPAFLTLDHIDGKGAEHRRRIANGNRCAGQRVYQWLKNNDFPKDNFRLLCFNCNCARHHTGKCPHETTKV